MVALSRCTTETVQPYGDCSMGDSPSQPPSALRKGSLEVGERRGRPNGGPPARGTGGCQAVPRGYAEGSARSRPLGPGGPCVTPLAGAWCQRAPDYDESKRGGARGTPWCAVGDEVGGSGSRTSGRAPQCGHGVRSIPVTSCIHWITLMGRRGGGSAGWPNNSRQRRRVRALCRLARKP